MTLETEFHHDVERVGRIDAVPRILDVVRRTTGMRFVAVARVTESRWICCSSLDDLNFGLKPGGELQIETTICNEIREHRKPVFINEVALDAVYCGHPTPAMYGFQSYASVPILRGGEFFGTLCAIDPKPARLQTPEVEELFKLFAELVGFHLDLQDQLATTQAALTDAREVAALREQFIAVLGHDLRNPLDAISAAAQLLRSLPAGEGPRVLTRIERSVRRMSELIGDATDFARGRLGGGLPITPTPDRRLLEAELHQVVAELRAAWPGRTIESSIELDRDVPADVPRIGQVLSNLLSNALKHGAADQPVTVGARTREGFELAVTNRGELIPEAAQRRMFQPFVRGEHGNQQGLGLGLYIVAEIAKSHGGSVAFTSDGEGTRFVFRLPDACVPVTG